MPDEKSHIGFRANASTANKLKTLASLERRNISGQMEYLTEKFLVPILDKQLADYAAGLPSS